MRSNLPFDDFTEEESPKGFRFWRGYNSLLDAAAGLLALTVNTTWTLSVYLLLAAAFVFISIYLGRTVAAVLYSAVQATPAAIYNFCVSIPGFFRILFELFISLFTHGIPAAFEAIATYPLTIGLSIVFLHLIVRAVFTTCGEIAEPDTLIRGSRIEGSLRESYAFSSDDQFHDEQGRPWLFPGRRWLTSEEKADRFRAFLIAVRDCADAMRDR